MKREYYIGLFLIIIVAIALYFFFIKKDEGVIIDIGTEGETTEFSDEDLSRFAKVFPDFSIPVSYNKDLSDDVVGILKKKIEDSVAILIEDNTNYEVWLDLSSQYKIAGDLEKTEKVWNFLLYINPNDAVILNNLGNLYHFEHKKYEEAEEYFNRALEVDPKNVLTYKNLFDLYSLSYKTDTNLAKDILEKGIAETGSPELEQELKKYLE